MSGFVADVTYSDWSSSNPFFSCPCSNPSNGVECRMDFGFVEIVIGEQISKQFTLFQGHYGSTSNNSLSFANNLSINKKTTVQEFPKLIESDL
jgi:hypothetical protein